MSENRALSPMPVVRDAPAPGHYLGVSISAFVLVAIVLVWASVFAITSREHEDARSSIMKSNQNLARVIEAHTIRTLDAASQLTREIVQKYHEQGANLDLPNLFESFQSDPALYLTAAVANDRGDTVTSSVRGLQPVNLADREHFKAHAVSDSSKLHISKPILARVTKRWSIVITQRVNNADGTFGGIAGVAIDPFYFTALYQKIDLGANGVITLTGLDGIVRARLDGGESSTGHDLTKSEVMRRMHSGELSGSFDTVSPIDGKTRIFSYQGVKGYPLVVGVGVTESVALDVVRQHRRNYFIGAAVVSLLLVLTAAQLVAAARRQRRHFAALADGERQLRASNVELEGSRQLLTEQQAALYQLTLDNVLSGDDLQMVFRRITETAAKVMRIARVSVWRFSDDRSALRCNDLYELTEDKHSAGAELKVSDFPAYFAALEQKAVIDASDGHTDSRTREFSVPYLTPLGIASMLDVPIFIGDRLDGVICFEHVGESLAWTPEQRLFGTALAHLVEIAEGHAERRRAAVELAKSAEIYRQTFIANPMPMWVRDGETAAFLAVNDAAIAGYGYSREEFLHMRSAEIRSQVDLPFLQQMQCDEAEQPGHTHTRITSHRRKDGTTLDVRVISHPFNHDGRPSRLVLATDITQVLRAEAALRESEQRLRALLDGIPDRASLKDAQGRFVAINRSFQQAYGIPEENIIGKTAFEIQPDAPSLLADEDRQVRTASTPLHVERKSYLDGTWRSIVKVPIRSEEGAFGGVICISHDITERKQIEHERQARDREQRHAFVREIHHRIKNHIQGVAGLLQGHARRQPALASQMQTAVSQLQSVAVIHGLQGASGGGVRLDEMMEAICESMRDFAAGTVTIQFRRSATSWLIGQDEAVPLALIVNELLVNAVKHTAAAGGRHTVEVEIDAAQASLRICNPGRLPPRFDASRAGMAGQGLGLVRSLLPAQGAVFELAQRGERVCATLVLQAPVVMRMDARDDTHAAELAARAAMS